MGAEARAESVKRFSKPEARQLLNLNREFVQTIVVCVFVTVFKTQETNKNKGHFY